MKSEYSNDVAFLTSREAMSHASHVSHPLIKFYFLWNHELKIPKFQTIASPIKHHTS